jgi:hypothetical protein
MPESTRKYKVTLTVDQPFDIVIGHEITTVREGDGPAEFTDQELIDFYFHEYLCTVDVLKQVDEVHAVDDNDPHGLFRITNIEEINS